jgi:tellurite resistance protein
MATAAQSTFSSEHIAAWLRGLLSIAWADGDFDDHEREFIESLTKSEVAPKTALQSLDPISPDELAAVFGKNTEIAQNFLRTAVMVAIADGVYSPPEDKVLHEFCTALGLDDHILESLRLTLQQLPQSDREQAAAAEMQSTGTSVLARGEALVGPGDESSLAPLRPVQEWLDQLDVQDPRVARFLCKMIPPQCPFERDVTLFGRKIVHIPPLCKLNPLYEQLVGLRFRALNYLAEDCGEDVTPYC